MPDPRNLFQDCRKVNIDPRNLTIDNLGVEIFIVHKTLEELLPLASNMRRDHLKLCLKAAQKRHDEKTSANLVRIMYKESKKKRWRRVKYSAGKRPAGQVLSVKVDTPEDTEEFTTEEGVCQQVSTNLSKRFRLAFSAPSCSGPLFDDIGFLGDTVAVQQILEGSYSFPANTDPATKLLLEEAAFTYAKMSTQEVASYATREDFQRY